MATGDERYSSNYDETDSGRDNEIKKTVRRNKGQGYEKCDSDGNMTKYMWGIYVNDKVNDDTWPWWRSENINDVTLEYDDKS